MRDISDRKISEQKLVDARDRAEKADRAKSQFLSVMSHEMRTPLNGILGVLELLKTTKTTKKQNDYLDVATASSEILMEHVNEALDVTRIETGEMSINETEFSLVAVINNITGILKPLASEKGLTLKTEIDDKMKGHFISDSQRIRQIVMNLVGNAIKFTNAGGVTIRLNGIHGSKTTAVRIDVEDTGVGVESELYNKIFEDFFTLDPQGERPVRGDGLGLPISRRISRLLGGDISVKSQIGKGSTFTLKLDIERSTATPQMSTDKSALDVRPDRSLRALIIEDNAVNRAVLSDMLQSLGHSVVLAHDGEEGVEAANKELFDIIFMDISMPNMNGLEATQEIRSGHGLNRNTHILGLTAFGRNEFNDSAEKAGMNDLQTKPIRLATLRQILKPTNLPLRNDRQSRRHDRLKRF